MALSPLKLADEQVWAHVISDLVLQPFALDDFEACLAQDDLEIQRIKKDNPGAGRSAESL